jgi:Fe2+ or Zn2+ uptake regulation protein
VEDITLGEHGFERQIKALARVKQFAVLRHSLEIFGWCKTCHQL